jgi:hypothetical protein
LPSWKEIQDETKAIGAPHDIVRQRYLRKLSELTGRNVIAYYSGWEHVSEESQSRLVGIDDYDTNGFMATIHRLNRSKGLDLILHTPGGEMGATESLVEYLREMFGTDIRAIVPHLAMSGGTMIALSCKEVVMGKHSRIGAIDPQLGPWAAFDVIEEFKRAAKEVKEDPAKAVVWTPIIAKYTPTLIGDCERAIEWSRKMVHSWLVTGMFRGDPRRHVKADRIVEALGNPEYTMTHAREITMKKARKLGIKIRSLEANPKLQDAVLSVHHACVQSLSRTSAVKIIDNQNGDGFVATIDEIMGTEPKPSRPARAS